jgi:hypothetical protein
MQKFLSFILVYYMQSIADISIFKTPFESTESFTRKFALIETMFEDYVVNAGMKLVREISENEHYITRKYSSENQIEVSFSFQKDLANVSYFPAGMVNYQLNPFLFQKDNIEHFLNDNIAFIWNVFARDFFIDYHSDYQIDDRNKGKKLDYESLGKFDMENPKSPANKELLDSLMYLYFGLMKSLFQLENNGEKLDQFLKTATLSDVTGTFELFSQRGDYTKDALISQAKLIKGQIDSFVGLIGDRD